MQAGLEIIEFVKQPIAATFAYGFDKRVKKREGFFYKMTGHFFRLKEEAKLYLFLDLAGSEFDIFFLKLSNEKMYMSDLEFCYKSYVLDGREIDQRL